MLYRNRLVAQQGDGFSIDLVYINKLSLGGAPLLNCDWILPDVLKPQTQVAR
jgi:hypothetical protein